MGADDEFREFVDSSYARLLRTAFLLTGDRWAAEDLTQSALTKTYFAWRRIEDTDKAEAYTRTAMVRLAVRWRRRRWSGERPTATLPESPTADRTAEVALADAAHRALAVLPAGQRAVLVLRYFHDCSEAEIAAALSCSVGTVKSRASRALETLRDSGLLDDEPTPGRSARTVRGRPASREA